MGHKKRESASAFAKPATGQAVPGALSAANTQTQSGGSSVAFPSRTESPFRQVDGKTQTLVNAPITDLNQQTPAFAAKLAEATGTQTPVNLGVFGTAPNDFSALNTSSNQNISRTPTSIFGAQADKFATDVINKAFDAVEFLGNGDFKRGLYSLITIPITSSAQIAGNVKTSASFKTTAKSVRPATVSQEAVTAGGSKTLNTIKTWISKLFTREELTQYINPKTGNIREVITRRPPNMTKAILGVGGVLGVLSYVIYGLVKDAKGGQATGQRDTTEEAGGMLMTYARDMFKAGDYETGYAFLDMAENSTKKVVDAIPFGGSVQQGTKNFADDVNTSIDMLRKHYGNLQAAAVETMTPEQGASFWTNYHLNLNVEEELSAKRRVDYFNSQQILTQNQIANAKANNRAEEAAFWLDYHRKLAKMEEEERQKQADFWLNYKKMVLRLQEDSGRSRLGFGLIR